LLHPDLWRPLSARTPPGGIFTSPHIGLVAEKWPEAIIPLSKGKNQGLLGGNQCAAYDQRGATGTKANLRALFDDHLQSIVREVQRELAI
jgi:hypothetical protein